MAYLFKQKLNIADLVSAGQIRKKVLIYEPEEYLSALYAHYLQKHNFDVKHCPDLANLREAIVNFEPHIFVFCSDAPIFKLLPQLNSCLPGMHLVSTGLNCSHERLNELMSAGVLNHLNRRLSRPQDLVVIINSILNN